MRISFTADTATFDEVEGALVAGLAAGDGGQSYLMLQRSLPDHTYNWGVYLGYSDQAYSAYNAIADCRVSREKIEVDLSKPLGDLKDVTGFDVELKVDDRSHERFLHGLRQVLADTLSARLQVGP